MIKKLFRIFEFYSGFQNSNVNRKIQSGKLIQRLRAESKSDLIKFGWKIYSQNDEDGIIHEIFKRIKI